MLILFFKSLDAINSERKRSLAGEGDEALEKIRAIFVSRVKDAKTDEERERAELELQKIE